MRFAKILLVVVICLAAAAAAFSAGYATRLVFGEGAVSPRDRDPHVAVVAGAPSTSSPVSPQMAGFEVFWEVQDLLAKNFIGALPSAQKMTYAAIRGVLAELKDPHTVFIEPPQRQLEKDEHRGRFGGIGVWLYQRETDHQIVLTPQEGGPAARAGVQDGDVLVRVDATIIDTAKITRDDAVALVRGPVGSRVTLGLRRQDTAGDIAVEMVREEFDTPSVEWRILDDRSPDTGYLRITQFTERTASEVRKAITGLQAKGAARLIVDLRDNPGGLLDSAIDVSSQFLGGGVIMYERNRDGSEKTYSATLPDAAGELPMVVLINNGSASAAEIVAGALHDRGRCTLVGERSYGKGSVQLVFDLSDGSSVHITVARWLTPLRHQIDGSGIEPDQPVALSDTDRQGGRDPQLSAAVAQVTSAGQP